MLDPNFVVQQQLTLEAEITTLRTQLAEVTAERDRLREALERVRGYARHKNDNGDGECFCPGDILKLLPPETPNDEQTA